MFKVTNRADCPFTAQRGTMNICITILKVRLVTPYKMIESNVAL